MLTKIRRTSSPSLRSDRPFAIVASEYNGRYVDAMVKHARAQLARAGVRQIEVIRVPGAYEVPLVAARLVKRQTGSVPIPAAVICLGVIIRGETVHAAHIGEAVSQALMEIQVQHGVPIIHEVLLLENEEQAKVRCLGKQHNRGTEAALTALKMAQVIEQVG